MQQYISNPKVTINIIARDQTLGLEDQRALIVGQIDPGKPATGTITFAANPTASSTITLNSTAVTFVASGATGSQVNIGANLAATLQALKTFLNASSDTQIVKCTYDVSGTKLFVRNKTLGTSGNSFTLAASVATVSASTLTGGVAGAGTAAGGTLVTDVPRTDAEINELFGATSHLAYVCRHFRAINPYTNMDCLPLADDSSAVRATSKIVFSGTATRAGSLKITVASEQKHAYTIDVAQSDTPVEILAKLANVIGKDRWQPFMFYDNALDTATFEACNGGPHANDWLIAIAGSIPGLSWTLTGWANGATNPSLTTLFEPVANIRYQTIVYPAAYATTTLKNFIDPRKNVDNDVKDGRAFVYQNVAFATAKTNAATLNSSEIVVMSNKPTSVANRWIGPHLPEAPDALAAKFAAARARRFESNISISDLVVTNEPADQFGGIDLASLPYFNTPLLGVGMPLKGTGYNYAEQIELETAGVTVLGVNRTDNTVIMGTVVTTWLNDAAGNPDDTWRYLEWRDTHGAIREFIVLNCRKRFAQYRLTTGELIPNRAMANEPMIRGYILDLCMQLADASLIVKGQPARQWIQDKMVVTLDLAARKATIYLNVPMVSQLGQIVGTVKFSFNTV